RLNLIVTTADTQRAHVTKIKSSELNTVIAKFRDEVKNPTTDPRESGRKLFDILLNKEVLQDLNGIQADTIIWSLDGVLRYVPISALWTGNEYLVEKYRNVVITLASRDRLKDSTPDRSGWQGLGLGVSKTALVTNEDGTSRTFGSLPAVPQEICGIIADKDVNDGCAKINENGVLKGKALLDDQFTLINFKNHLGRYPIVHIASHFVLNAGSETDSYLLLGGGAARKLTLADIRRGGTRFTGVELLTLSACDTAMGSSNKSNGVEVEGFGALAQNQGAKAVLASLWPVADESTRELMIEFYRQLESTPKITKAEALQRAQLTLLRGNSATPGKEEGRGIPFGGPSLASLGSRFSHPYYWSPFVLMGNWQ
ncbi:MAG TPA: CHAT domain-containing protein, partial [Pyrinomonadaceae bacterium]|nr:CHAT domain-containing protein [Pyrinomonadaceae bacterium]